MILTPSLSLTSFSPSLLIAFYSGDLNRVFPSQRPGLSGYLHKELLFSLLFALRSFLETFKLNFQITCLWRSCLQSVAGASKGAEAKEELVFNRVQEGSDTKASLGEMSMEQTHSSRQWIFLQLERKRARVVFGDYTRS